MVMKDWIKGWMPPEGGGMHRWISQVPALWLQELFHPHTLGNNLARPNSHHCFVMPSEKLIYQTSTWKLPVPRAKLFHGNQDFLRNWFLGKAALIWGLEACIHLPESSTGSAPHPRCCIISDLPCPNNCSSKPRYPHPGTNLGIVFHQSSSRVPHLSGEGEEKQIGLYFGFITPLPQKMCQWLTLSQGRHASEFSHLSLLHTLVRNSKSSLRKPESCEN